MSEKVIAYDVTLRDGTQGEGISFSVQDKIRISHKIDELGVKYIEGGWPGSNARDEGFFEQVKKEKYSNSNIVAFGSTRRAKTTCEKDSNIQALLKAETSAVTIVGKTWDFHVSEALKISNEENFELITDSINYLSKRVDEVFFDAEHFFDGYKSNSDFSQNCLTTALESGATGVVLCDTNGGTTPWEISEIVTNIKKTNKNIILGIHTHNDSGLGVANALAAVRAGANQVQGTINGYGERCGNANLCTIIANLNLKMGINCISDKNLTKLYEVSNFISDMANLSKDGKAPFIGKSAFAHKGGIHVSAIVKNNLTYEHVDPQKIGNQRRILISDLAGRSNILYKLNELKIADEVSDENISEILSELKKLENYGYEFEGVDASFELLVKKVSNQYKPKIELIETEINTRQIVPSNESSAKVVIKIDNEIIENTASGSGPVNALDLALRGALLDKFQFLNEVVLTDYRVRVVGGNKGTESLVRVIIESSDKDITWSTIGVSKDIVDASWKALIDSIEFKLMKASS
ncbi:MAG: citramalate synthase [Thermodesulfobacteriota bacterium]|nr:MAG: citramalate synthase [Candidatus Dadabacteria bacterium]|tara:strand:+ start:24493 stop:26061 length:1569 start_codon:yes stop_codon:yes gene_type:complete